MFLSYKYKLYPTQDQEVQLKCTLASLCDLYNELRSEKVNKYKENGKNLNRTDLRRLTLEKRRSNDKLQAIHSQVVQNTADRLSSAFKNFFEGRAKFPKNKKYKNYKSSKFLRAETHIIYRWEEQGFAIEIGGCEYSA
jgi:putative transposase